MTHLFFKSFSVRSGMIMLAIFAQLRHHKEAAEVGISQRPFCATRRTLNAAETWPMRCGLRERCIRQERSAHLVPTFCTQAKRLLSSSSVKSPLLRFGRR